MDEEINIIKCKNCLTENRISRKKLQNVANISGINPKALCKTCGMSLMYPISTSMIESLDIGKCRKKCALGRLGKAYFLNRIDIPIGKTEIDGMYYYMDASTRVYTRDDYISIYNLDPEKYLNWLESNVTIKTNSKRSGFK